MSSDRVLKKRPIEKLRPLLRLRQAEIPAIASAWANSFPKDEEKAGLSMSASKSELKLARSVMCLRLLSMLLQTSESVSCCEINVSIAATVDVVDISCKVLVQGIRAKY